MVTCWSTACEIKMGSSCSQTPLRYTCISETFHCSLFVQFNTGWGCLGGYLLFILICFIYRKCDIQPGYDLYLITTCIFTNDICFSKIEFIVCVCFNVEILTLLCIWICKKKGLFLGGKHFFKIQKVDMYV